MEKSIKELIDKWDIDSLFFSMYDKYINYLKENGFAIIENQIEDNTEQVMKTEPPPYYDKYGEITTTIPLDCMYAGVGKRTIKINLLAEQK